jgi:hypothetical protein
MRRLAGHRAGVPRMQGALVDDVQALGGKVLRQRGSNSVDRVHASCPKISSIKRQ